MAVTLAKVEERKQFIYNSDLAVVRRLQYKRILLGLEDFEERTTVVNTFIVNHTSICNIHSDLMGNRFRPWAGGSTADPIQDNGLRRGGYPATTESGGNGSSTDSPLYIIQPCTWSDFMKDMIIQNVNRHKLLPLQH